MADKSGQCMCGAVTFTAQDVLMTKADVEKIIASFAYEDQK